MHDNVDSAETLTDSVGDHGTAFGGGYIGRDELVGMSRIFRPRPRRGEDCRACFAKRRDDRLADTLGAAGDERAFSFKFEIVVHE
jgi:hypothetical protein